MRLYFRHPFPYLAALLVFLLYCAIPPTAHWVATHSTFARYAHVDASRISVSIPRSLLFPFGQWLGKTPRLLLVFPYWLLIFLGLRALFLHTRRAWKYVGGALVLILLLLYLFPNSLQLFENDRPSESIGHVANGRIEHSKRMYYHGDNYTTYSFLCYLLGRTHVNDRLRKVLVEAYAACAKTCPGTTFVVGEIGKKHGGAFLPHRTHRNGLSVDFMTPLLKGGKAYRNPQIWNLWGYAYEFDDRGKKKQLVIDYEAMAKHLYALDRAARANGMVIQKVIFDPVLRPLLLRSEYGPRIQHLPFTKNRVVIRHDDHYHIDFGIPSR